MSNPAQDFIQRLDQELKAKFVPLKYTVEAREPIEGELIATADARQIFITSDGFEFPDPIADQGSSTRLIVPVQVACVMKRPRTVTEFFSVLKRRLTIVQACQRTVKNYGVPSTLVTFVGEQPNLIEGYYVSITQVNVQFDLDAEEEL
jgi:hypothetical protein